MKESRFGAHFILKDEEKEVHEGKERRPIRNSAVGNPTELVEAAVCPGDLVLANATVTTAELYESCDGITAGPDYTVATGPSSKSSTTTSPTSTCLSRSSSSAGTTTTDHPSNAGPEPPSDDGSAEHERVAADRATPDDRTSDHRSTVMRPGDPAAPMPASLEPGVSVGLERNTWGTKSWTYDRIGNRLTETDGDGTDTYSYAPNPADGNTALLESIALPTLGSRDFQYTPAGHQTQVAAGANVVDFGYDDAGRLEEAIRSTDPPTSVPFLYDGRSFLRRAGDLATSGTVEPLYDSAGLLHGLLRQPSATDPQTGYLIFYLAGRPVAQVALEPGEPDRWWYLTTDHLGTPLVATDGAGEELWENRFEPFGRDMDEGTAASALASEMFMRFPGQWEDEVWQEATMGADVYYNVNRWYQIDVGRYGRVDPLGIAVGENLYLYASSRPVGAIDPTGLFQISGDVPDCLVEYLRNRMPDVQFNTRIISAIGAASGTGLKGSREAREAVQWGKGPVVKLGVPRTRNGKVPFAEHLNPFSDIILIHPRDVQELCECGPGPDGLRLLEIGKTLLHELTHWIEGKAHHGRLDYEAGDTFKILTYGKPPGGPLGYQSWRNQECCRRKE